MSLSRTVNEILSLISQNLKRSRDSEHFPFGDYNMRALILKCINQQMKYEVSSFTNSKDMIGAKLKNGSHDSDNTN